MVIAVSPIISDKTVKGPAAKMFSELGIQPSALAVTQHYNELIHSIVIDNSDGSVEKEINQLGIHTILTNILMRDQADRGRLAQEIIDHINVILRGR
jgi:LPPG:FO 2-phospho-L-lactate transferase